MFQDQDNLRENPRTDQYGGGTSEADLIALQNEDF
jgi:hypothetical protein